MPHRGRTEVVQKSGAKGRSKAHRLNDLLRELLALMLKLLRLRDHFDVDRDLGERGRGHLSLGRVDDFSPPKSIEAWAEANTKTTKESAPSSERRKQKKFQTKTTPQP